MSAADLAPIGLEELVARASLQTRIDRKYVVPVQTLAALVDGLPDARVLEIDGRRTFAYESVYHDTPGLACYLGAARRRRHRYKVRTRTYLDSGASFVEVKTRGPRGCTIKTRRPTTARGALGDEDRAFADELLDDAPGALLAPVLASRYDRTTLFLPDDASRTTVDTDLVWTSALTGAEDRLTGRAVVETKTGSTPSAADRLLWRLGHRPVRISKYGTGMAALHPHLPATPWHRVLTRHVMAA